MLVHNAPSTPCAQARQVAPARSRYFNLGLLCLLLLEACAAPTRYEKPEVGAVANPVSGQLERIRILEGTVQNGLTTPSFDFISSRLYSSIGTNPEQQAGPQSYCLDVIRKDYLARNLGAALSASGMIHGPSGKKLRLDVTVLKATQPGWSAINSSFELTNMYEIVDLDSGIIIARSILSSNAQSTNGDAFTAGTRFKIATERAIVNNFSQYINAFSCCSVEKPPPPHPSQLNAPELGLKGFAVACR